MQKTMGVYIIKNMNTGKVYVGSSMWAEQRMKQHEVQMREGCHPNPRIRGAASKTTMERFQFAIIESVSDKHELGKKELGWILHYNSVNNGYNRTYKTESYTKEQYHGVGPHVSREFTTPAASFPVYGLSASPKEEARIYSRQLRRKKIERVIVCAIIVFAVLLFSAPGWIRSLGLQ